MRSFKVGGITYHVFEVEGLIRDHDLYGRVLYTHPLIKVDAGIPKDRKDQVLVHELLHAIFYEAGYEEQDEDMINRVANILYQVLRDNDFSFIRPEVDAN